MTENQKEFLLKIVEGSESVPKRCKGFHDCEGYQCPFLEISYYHEGTTKGNAVWKSKRRCCLLFIPRSTNEAKCTLSDFLEYVFKEAI